MRGSPMKSKPISSLTGAPTHCFLHRGRDRQHPEQHHEQGDHHRNEERLDELADQHQHQEVESLQPVQRPEAVRGEGWCQSAVMPACPGQDSSQSGDWPAPLDEADLLSCLGHHQHPSDDHQEDHDRYQVDRSDLVGYLP